MDRGDNESWVSVEFERDALQPRLRLIYDYWSGKCGDGRLPRRQDLDPLEIPTHCLPWMMILERVDEPSRVRWRFRLVGTALVEQRGHDVTGKFVDEVTDGQQRRHLLELFDLFLESRRPVFEYSEIPRFSKEIAPLNSLVLPLSSCGEVPDAALVIVHIQGYD